MKLPSARLLVVTLLAFPALEISAATIYSSLQNVSIPTNFNGVYLDIDTGATSTTAFTGWDINPFFGGVGIGNSAAFQPVRLGSGNLERVLNLTAGTIISSTQTYSSGFGGSGNTGNEHIGAATNQFQVGSEGYLGFKFTTNASSGPLYGWMRLTLTNNAAGAVIKDWGYDDAGGTIVIGRIQQSAAVMGAQTVTLSPANGESFSLGSAISDTSGNINSLLKTGLGSTNLASANTFTGTTTIAGGTLEVATANGLGNTSSISVNSGGTLLLGNAATTDRINNSATIKLAGGAIAFNGSITEGSTGALTLTANSVIDFAGGNNRITFAASNVVAWTASTTLSIYNWNGNYSGGGNDQLKFGTANTALLAGQLSQISFYEGGLGSNLLGTGGFVGATGEIVPVPEPSTVFGAFFLLGAASWRAWRQRI